MKNLYHLIFVLFAAVCSSQTIPTLTAPVNGADLNTNGTVLNWNDVSENISYSYEYDTANTFDSPLLTVGSVVASQLSLTHLAFGTTYYWRVKTVTSSGSSGWSATRHFTTIGSVTLYAPSNNATIYGTSAILEWLDGTGETGFLYQLDTVNTFDSSSLQSLTHPAFDNAATGHPTAGVTNLSFGTIYFWRVAILDGDLQSGWSATRKFTVQNAATLYQPANNAVINGINVSLICLNAVGETGYAYQIDTTNTFDSAEIIAGTIPAYSDSSTGNPGVFISGLAFGTTYYWRMALMNGSDQSGWSAPRAFTTTNGVTLNSPNNNATNTGNAVVALKWNDVTGETGYTYQVDTANTFDSPNLISGVRDAFDSVGLPSVGVSGLLADTTYFWRVAILKDADQSGWSSVWRFATGATLATASFEKTQLTIFPNPTQNKVDINGNSLRSYRIFGSNGQALGNGNFSQANDIDVSHLASGIYFIEVMPKDGLTEMLKLIKN